MTVTRLDHASFDWASGAGGAAEVRRIADSALRHDGRESLNEAAILTLRNRGLETGLLFLSGEEGFAYVHGLSGGGRPELDLVVEPSARGRGVAKGLLNTIIADAAGRGRDRVGLEVDADSPTGAAELYNGMGWMTSYITESWHRDVPVTQPGTA